MKQLKLVLAYFCYFAVIAAIVIYLVPSKKGLNSAKGQELRAYTNKSVKVSPKINDFASGKEKYIILTFDDGWSSQYAAFKLLKPLKATLYINSSLIGQEDRLTLNNLTEMYNNGWDIANHTASHVNLTKVSLEKANEEIQECSRWIIEHGFTRDMAYKHFAYPEGSFDHDIIEVLKNQNFLTARTTEAGSNINELLQLGRASLFGMTKKNIRDLILSDKKILILSFHRLVPDSSTRIGEIDLKESYFREVINSIFESKRKVLTLTEWFNLNYDTSEAGL